MINHPSLRKLKLHAHTIQFFEPSLLIKNGRITLKAFDDSGNGIGFAGSDIAILVRHLYLSYDATEALCFAHYNPHLLCISRRVAFCTLGFTPTSQQVNILNSKFPGVKIHTVFGNDLPGRVTDCKIALWRIGKTAAYSFRNEFIHVYHCGNVLKIPAKQFSMNRLEKLTGIRSGVRTEKAPGQHVDWLSFKINS